MVKLKINTSAATISASTPKPPAKKASSSSSASKPSTPSGIPRITIKTKPSVPTLKLKSSSFSAASGGTGTPTLAPAPPIKTPVLKLKSKSVVPRKRRYEPGNGYDSEASDREEDPAIEEQFILRMPPGEDCEYLREIIEKKELSTTSDVWFKFKDSRRAVVCVRGNLYAALLVDLPCIVESNKTLDKKAIFKAADICQMLLVTEKIENEAQVLNVSTRFQDITYPHGITPPMQYVRKRRFRKRVSNRTIEAVEAEVDRLLRDDENAIDSNFSLVDMNELTRENSVLASEEGEGYDLLRDNGMNQEDYDDEQDAEGEIEDGYEYPNPDNDELDMDEDTLANDLESALMGGNDAGGDENNGSGTVRVKEEESDDEDEDEDEDAAEMDEAAQEAQQEMEKVKEEIQDLEEAIKAKISEYDILGNPLLKARVKGVITSLRAELDLKLQQLGGRQ
ncbi:hypothetical protein RUND412_008321 [Rhizina undulata]